MNSAFKWATAGLILMSISSIGQCFLANHYRDQANECLESRGEPENDK